MSTFVTSIERLAHAEAQLQLVLRQLARKVGGFDATVRERIEALDSDALLHLSEALLDFTTPDDLIAWLEGMEEIANSHE